MNLEIEVIAEQVLSGNRRALAQAITLIESTRSDHRNLAVQLLERLLPHSGRSIRLGISGVPGVGKSTFIEAFGNHVIDTGHRVAVLTVDPSSVISGGSILGDKTRMEKLSRHDKAFIRPSPSGTTLGGVTRRTQETLILCEAAGYDVVMVETVGVGQSETQVSEMTDMFLLLLLPGAGDELQGIKRGIMELADLILINKADDDLLPLANQTASEYRNALRLLHPARVSDWEVPVLTCSSRDGVGLSDAWEKVIQHRRVLEETKQLTTQRAQQARKWLWSEVQGSLVESLKENDDIRSQIPILESSVSEGKITPSSAAQQLLDYFHQRNNQSD